MPIPPDVLNRFLPEFSDPQLTNLFAQAHAKHVLLEIGEDPRNFPRFDAVLEEKVTFVAYALAAAGCSLAEQDRRAEGAIVLERAASLIEYVHGPASRESRDASLHVLLAAMAFYAAGHYSRAFVAMQRTEPDTPAARILGAFLRKDTNVLVTRLNEVLLGPTPEIKDQSALNDWAITTAIARAVSMTLEFFYTGDQRLLDRADEQLQDALVVAALGQHAVSWFIVRLTRLILRDAGDASPWKLLPPYIDPRASDLLGAYIRLLAFSKVPVTEIWSSQRAALPLALSDRHRGAVINLRTGAGKTRVAEIAILKTLTVHPESRVLYLAPFRSLAIEVERSLSATFHPLGFPVSHLYGGSRISSIDAEMVANSRIIIATPEKTRALLRAKPELLSEIRLLIIDEGHLIGPSERYVRNEIFLDHLRVFAHELGARVLLLSAVLPNASELAEWITGNDQDVVRSTWKPSAERFGLLRWNGNRVRIEWQGEVRSFNPSFIEAKPLKFGKRRKLFPRNKSEAVAASAVRLSSTGPVMIFAGKAVSVPTLAGAALIALGENPPAHPWPEHEWKVFEAVCKEELGTDSIEFRAAVAGVVCHSDRLTPQVRLALEHLMRSKPPKIIIATTTLGSGVNVGISSVIIASPYISKKPIDKRDFWNICGRAGRAFVDGEGKLLYAIDDTREEWQVKKDERLAASYFDTTTSDPVKSGLLYIVAILKRIAKVVGIQFDHVIELIANNDFRPLGEHAESAEYICDLVDDELLAMHMDRVINLTSEDPEKWVEPAFRHSLALIQARASESAVTPDEVFAFLKARARSAVSRTSDDSSRTAVAASGLPLSVGLRALSDLDIFRRVADSFALSDGSLDALSRAVRDIEDWVRENGRPISQAPSQEVLDVIRPLWLGGVGLREIANVSENATEVCKEFYGYGLPWIAHAAAQQLRASHDINRAQILAKLALLVEIGVPNELAAHIFLAGIRSRVAATELSGVGVDFGKGVRQVGFKLRDPSFVEELRPLVSPSTLVWLQLMATEAVTPYQDVPDIPPFKLDDSGDVGTLHARIAGDRLLLCTPDGIRRFVPHPDVTLAAVANDPRIAFTREGDTWRMQVRDPRIQRKPPS